MRIVYFVAFFIFSVFVNKLLAQENEVILKIAAELKLEPKSSSNTIKNLVKGDKITILNNWEKYGDYGGFYAARYKSQSGYINDIYINKNIIQTQSKTNINKNTDNYVVLRDWTRLYERDNVKSEVLISIPDGKRVKIVSENNNSDFVKVEYWEYSGYILKSDLYKSTQNIIQSLPPILSIISIESSENTLFGSHSIQLSITLKNSGPGDARDVFANLSCDLSGISLPDKINFPVIKAQNGEETITVDIEGGLDLPTAEAVIKIEIIEPNFKIRIPGKQLRIPTVAFQNPKLILAQYAVIENQSANPNNQIDINEMIDLKFAVQNIGQGDAEKVEINVENRQDGVMFLGIEESGKIKRENPTFKNINPGKYETIVFKYFVNSDFTDNQMEFTITSMEKHNKFGFTEKKSFPINKQLEESGQIRKVAIVEENTNKQVIIEDIPDFVVDVDTDIPSTNVSQANSYVLIIGNEDYKSKQGGLTNEQNVDFAINDAVVFSQYCKNTLGVPSNQIKVLKNATAAEMNQGLAWISQLAKLEKGNAKLMFYYSGHGLPNESTGEAFLIPVDVAATNLDYAIKLDNVYQKLTENPSKQVTVFLDACFSGGGRNQGLLTMKGVKIKPKLNEVNGNMVVFSSSTGEESSAVYRAKQHGYFTYFLLKKLKETKGESSLNELNNFIVESVTKQTALEGKIQTPQIKVSQQLENNWGNLKLK